MSVAVRRCRLRPGRIPFISLSSFATDAVTSTPPPLDAAAVLAALSGYANDWRRALDFYHWAASPVGGGFAHTPSTLARAVDILGKHFEFPAARELLFSQPPRPSFDHRPALRSLLNRLAAAGLVAEATDAFRSVAADLGIMDASSFHLLIDALCDHRRVADAEEICLRGDLQFPLDTKICNLLLRGYLKCGAWRRSRELWEEMDRCGIRKDLHSYSICMDAFVKSGKPWKAVRLFNEMRRRRVSLDVVAYNTAIHAVGRAKGVDFAVQLFRGMRDCGCPPNAATFNTVVKLLCMNERFTEAYAFVGQMRRAGCEPDALTYHCFFQHSSRPQEILKLFDMMLARGCPPRMDTYVMLIKKFGKMGFLRPVFKVWKVMEDQGCSPDAFAYGALIDALLEKGLVDMARKYNEEMLAKGLSPKPKKEFGTRWPGVDADDGDNVMKDVF